MPGQILFNHLWPSWSPALSSYVRLKKRVDVSGAGDERFIKREIFNDLRSFCCKVNCKLLSSKTSSPAAVPSRIGFYYQAHPYHYSHMTACSQCQRNRLPCTIVP